MLSETCDNTESGNESDRNSTMPTLISEEETYVMDSGDESDDEHMYKEMLKDIRDGINSHLSINRR